MRLFARHRVVLTPLLSLVVVVATTLIIANHHQVEAQPLRNVVPDGFAVGGVLYGYGDWLGGNLYTPTASREFNAVTSSIFMSSTGFDFSGFTRVVDWARQRNMRVHGHSLIYPTSNKGFWEENPGLNAHNIINSYVQGLCDARKGDIWVWDVVNEVFGYDGYSETPLDQWGLTTNFREYNDVGNGGGEYVELAFKWAKACDPNAKLIINEANAEEFNDRTTRIFNYMVQKRSEGVPIDGIGMQMHVFGVEDRFAVDVNSLRRNVRRFVQAGFEVYFTEMDVMSPGASANRNNLPSSAQQARQASIYRSIAELAVTEPGVKSLLLWDFADDRSWLHPNNHFELDPAYPLGTYFFPCPWRGGYDSMTPKPAYFALRDGLSSRSNNNVSPVPGPSPSGPTWHRLISDWNADTSYLGRHGDPDGNGGWDPSRRTGLFKLNTDWSSLQWTFESLGGDRYRIRNRWGEGGYLTRDGVKNGDTWEPGPTLSIRSLEEQWDSQKWIISPAENGFWRIINVWGSTNGWLTRAGDFDEESQRWLPSDRASFAKQRDEWRSQYWKTP